MMKTFLQKNKFIIALLLTVFILRLPSLFEPYWYGDEGISLTIGLAIKKGYLLYRDVFDNKPPLLYLIAALANGSMFWFRFLLDISVLGSIFFFYRLAQKIFASQNSAKIAVLAYSLLTTVRLLEGNVGNSEIFMLLPTVLGFWLIYSSGAFFLAGLSFSIAFLLKVPALFDFLAILTFLVFFLDKKKLFQFGKREAALCGGFLLPTVLVGLFFLLKGAFGVFFNSTVLQTMGYLSSWKTGSHAFSLVSLLKTDLFIKGFIILIIFLLLLIRKKELRDFLILVPLWLVFSLFAATLSGRPYPHYLIQVIPSLSLAVGFFLVKKQKLASLIALGLILILSLTVIRYHFWAYTTPSYYQNFIQFVLGQKDKNSYLSYFNQGLPNLYQLAQFIDARTKAEEKIFIWADEPSLYALSQRLPATPYLTAYHIVDLHYQDRVIKRLDQEKPPLIVIDQKGREFPALKALVADHYLETEKFDNLWVYQIKP